MVAVAPRRRPHAAERVTAGARLGQAPGTDLLGAQHGPREALDLLGGAFAENVSREEPGARAVAESEGRADARHLDGERGPRVARDVGVERGYRLRLRRRGVRPASAAAAERLQERVEAERAVHV